MENELETPNPYLTLTNGDFNMNITEDGLYSMPSIPLDSAYHIYQSNDSNLAPAFRCEGDNQIGVATQPFVQCLLYCSWHSKILFCKL